MAAKPHLSCQLEMDILSRVAAKIGQYLDLDKVLATGLAEIFSALRVNHGCVYLLDPTTGALILRTQRHLSGRFIAAKSSIKAGEGCAGTAVVAKKTFAPTKAERTFVCKESQALLGLDCLAAIPIVAKGEVLGVLELFAPVARRLSANERELVEAINNQLAVAIKNASTHASLQHALDNTRKLLQATETITATLEFDTILEYLARLACELTGVSRAAIAFFDPETQEAEFVVSSSRNVPRGARVPISGWVWQTVYEKGRAVAVQDISDLPERSRQWMEKDNVGSILIVPLRFAGRTLGALYLDEPFHKHKFIPLAIELAEGIARHAAAAIQNARSFESTQKALVNAQALLEASEMVATILDPDILLNQLARLVPKLTGIARAGIWLLDAEGDELLMAIPPAPGLPVPAACPVEGSPLKSVIHQGAVVILTDVSELPGPLRSLMRRQRVKSLLMTPLHYGSDVIGLLTLYDNDRPHDFSPDEIGLAEAISHHAAIGVVNARSFAEQRRIAETLQQGFVPTRPPCLQAIDLGVSYRSASEGAFVGGDFYDFLSVDGELGICIGDVSGRGIDAASMAGRAKSTIRAYAVEDRDPSSVLKRTNKIIVKQTSGRQFITLTFGVLDAKRRTFRYASAGHPPPLLLREGKADFLRVTNNLPIGVRAGTTYKAQETPVRQQSFLVFYTDGLIEARRERELFGPERLREAASRHSAGTAQDLVDGTLSEVEDFSGHRLVDDIAIVALRIT